MASSLTIADEHHEHNQDATDVLGFWLYIMTDCVLFGTLFATFLVLNAPAMHAGLTLKQFIDLPYVLVETFLLLASNFTYCLAMLDLYQNKLQRVLIWLFITFLFGASFVGMELYEFIGLAAEGFRWDYSGQASSFFTLVGTHGLHVSIGLLWILIMMFQLPLMKISHVTKRRMTYLGMFWNFLDIVWIFVFTIVYLLGAIA
jgi:cytochrome o ubiquinol oxidase subunit 3